MIKKLSIILIILVLCCGIVYAGNNTEPVLNPTMNIIEGDTVQAIEGGDSNLSFSEGYKGYCAEWGEHSAEEGQDFILSDTNKINNSNYLKTMFLFFYNQTQKDVYATQHMVWKFTDNKQFSRFNQTWYNQIIDTGDKYTVPDAGKIKLNDTHQFSFDFKALVPSFNEFQTFFAYQFLIEKIPDNSTIEINNTTNNNSTIVVPEYQNNGSYVQNNNSDFIDGLISKKASTLDVSNIIETNEKTGANLWFPFCIAILLFITLILSRKR